MNRDPGIEQSSRFKAATSKYNEFRETGMEDVLEPRPDRSYQAATLTSQDQIRKHALETFGTEDKALHWLRRPNQLFGGKTPIDALESHPEAVEQELIRIDHGIFV